MKTVIYQIFTRLWGNLNEHPVYNGTRAQNGCGTMDDVTTKALRKLREMGVTHVWYTGLLHHATATRYADLGIAPDHTAMVKGLAGSPYAIRDYYDVDPDLARQPEQRMEAFDALVERTHSAGLKFVMDFVPNHVARSYHSTHLPEGERDLGADDNRDHAFNAQNNFYYLPGQSLRCDFDMKGDELLPYDERPARVTGNDCFNASPGRNDWYETIKLNYGVDYCDAGGRSVHFDPIPSTWHKMLRILRFWAARGVDAFRCDMAEMVPSAFWHYATTELKKEYPDVLFIGEVYNPALYREYIAYGGFDLLYDKVGLYDALRAVVCHHAPASILTSCWQATDDIAAHMLNFLENHDEQRLASDFYAASPEPGRPALVVAACMRSNPFMLYFAQELGERGMDHEGFSGRDGRTTIFDYWSISTLRRWQQGDYTERLLTAGERDLQRYYRKVLNLSTTEPALTDGAFFDVMYANYDNPQFNSERLFAFLRHDAASGDTVLVVANFDDKTQQAQVKIPSHAFDHLSLAEGAYRATHLLSRCAPTDIQLTRDGGVEVEVPAYGAVMIKLKQL